MFFPYFRGRQYELLALKELATKKLISSAIVPIIEPVKIAVFDESLFECKSVHVVEISSIEYSYSKVK